MHTPPMPVVLNVNGQDYTVDAAHDTPLMMILRNDLALNGPKYGCGLGECGACMVLIDGIPARSCVVPLAGVRGRRITTLEGLGSAGNLHPVQRAFIDAQAAQCGYCLNGMIMTTVALLGDHPDPSDAQIRSALSGNFCRCGAHVEIVEAVRASARLMATQASRGGR